MFGSSTDTGESMVLSDWSDQCYDVMKELWYMLSIFINSTMTCACMKNRQIQRKTFASKAEHNGMFTTQFGNRVQPV